MALYIYPGLGLRKENRYEFDRTEIRRDLCG